MSDVGRNAIVEKYRQLFLMHGDTPEALQWDAEAQRFRFERLAKFAPLAGTRVLDVGCGLGHFYPFLLERFGGVDYTGIDIVPETIAHATDRFPAARFMCHDLLSAPLQDQFDYAFISGTFNNAEASDSAFLHRLIRAAFEQCTGGLAFNFISTVVNYREPEMAYHDPLDVLNFCIEKLSPRVMIDHHYERCDVAVFVRR